MPRRLKWLTIAGMALAAVNMADDSCDDWDQEDECGEACTHLTNCENEWLADEGKTVLDTDTSDEASTTAWNTYYNDCFMDCDMHGDDDEILCIQESSCDELRDGKCAD